MIIIYLYYISMLIQSVIDLKYNQKKPVNLIKKINHWTYDWFGCGYPPCEKFREYYSTQPYYYLFDFLNNLKKMYFNKCILISNTNTPEIVF